MRKPKIGDRATWTSLDPTVPQSCGRVVEVSPSGKKVEIEWDDGEIYNYDLTDKASGVRLCSP